ncbi:hypothetical protein [Rhabdaerophilum sp.]|uniref:hypothetical protein n=1 Tax=Rhabdaerophilum sp. TaxID=2717341 RepID=UPI0038D4D1A6
MESDKTNNCLSLAEAQVSGRLEEFIVQEEARGVGPADRQELDEALSRLITAGKSGDRTSRSASSDGLSGTKTR